MLSRKLINSFKINFVHFKTLILRYINIIFSDKLYLTTLLLQAPIMVFVIKLTCQTNFTYYDGMMTLFIISCIATFMGILNSYREICKERDVLFREYKVGLNAPGYVLSKFFVQGLISLYNTIIIVIGCIIFTKIPIFNQDDSFYRLLMFIIIIYLTLLASSSLALMISSIIKNSESAILPVLIIIISQVVLSGALTDLPANISFMSNFTISKWTVSGLGSIFDIPNIAKNHVIGFNKELNVPITYPQSLREIYYIPLYINILVLIGISVVSNFLSIIFIRISNRKMPSI